MRKRMTIAEYAEMIRPDLALIFLKTHPDIVDEAFMEGLTVEHAMLETMRVLEKHFKNPLPIKGQE